MTICPACLHDMIEGEWSVVQNMKDYIDVTGPAYFQRRKVGCGRCGYWQLELRIVDATL